MGLAAAAPLISGCYAPTHLYRSVVLTFETAFAGGTSQAFSRPIRQGSVSAL